MNKRRLRILRLAAAVAGWHPTLSAMCFFEHPSLRSASIMIRFSSVRRWYFGAPGGVFRRSFVAIDASLRFFALQESIQPTPDFFNPRLKPARQANRSRQDLPVLHWKLARAVLALILFARMNPVKDESELDDDDSGIDWQEKNVCDEIVQMWDSWAVLIDDVPVHEAKALAERLEASQIRCRLELLKEDRAFHRFGNGGMGTRMCVLVAPSDYAAAKKLLMEHNGTQSDI